MQHEGGDVQVGVPQLKFDGEATKKDDTEATKIQEEELFAEQNDKLALTSDIYAYAFYCFVKKPSPVLLGELIIKCFFTIAL